jgi:hypothetical protein
MALVQVPDGKGGYKEIEADVIKGGRANPDKQAKALEQSWYDDACKLTDDVLKFAQLRAREMNLTKEQFAFAGNLMLINMRETYPGKDPKTVDTSSFDDIGKLAWEYWDDANKPKRK